MGGGDHITNMGPIPLGIWGRGPPKIGEISLLQRASRRVCTRAHVRTQRSYILSISLTSNGREIVRESVEQAYAFFTTQTHGKLSSRL